ncbi:MAG: hypothetical protein MZV70_03325 [Desulfobacterales bacterium]|nr:hypothetical protein [Desulfobacterales bacterium]
MVQSIERFQSTFKKARKQFNPKQIETGQYTPTITFAFDTLPIVIKALSEAWESHRGDEQAGQVIPEANAALDDYKKMAAAQAEDLAVSNFGEFGGRPPKPTPAAPITDIWGELSAQAKANKAADAMAAPIGEDMEDELAGFGEFGGSPARDKKRGRKARPPIGTPF